MKIVLENVVHAQKSKRGIGTYFQNLATALADQDKTNQYVLFNYFFRDFEARRKESFSLERANFTSCVRRAPQRVVESLEWRWGIPVIDFMLPRDTRIYHAIESRLPHLSPRIRTVVTVHDMFLELFPKQWFGQSRAVLRDACLRADKLIAISQNTKRDLQRLYGIPDEKIAVILYGMDHATFYPVEDPSRLNDVRRRYGLPERFLLSTGPFEPRRNMESLLDAFASLAEAPAARGLSLVLTGGTNPHLDLIRKKAADLGLADRVLFPGHVPQSDLAVLYRLAEVFVYPSLYEGFGLTPLEALACGAPVVASNVSSIPEVVGDAAVLIDPTNTPELKSAIRRLIESPDARRELAAQGPARAKRFTWEAAAERTRDVYRTLST